MAETNIKDVKLRIGTETQFQSKLKDLPLNTLVGTTDPIQEGELDTSIITKLNKADNALPKPTNDTTGSAGQVLKKTANGSEWGDAPSGGGKLYYHNTMISDTAPGSTKYLNIIIICSKAEKFTINDIDKYKYNAVSKRVTNSSNSIYEVRDIAINSNTISAYYYDKYPYPKMSTTYFDFNTYTITDTVAEL